MNARGVRDARFEVRDYDTPLDRFRQKEGLVVEQWAAASRVARKLLFDYRARGAWPRADTFARLVRGAATLLGRPVRASELCDLGEDEPVGASSAALTGHTWKRYSSRFDQTLAIHNISPLHLATASGLTRATIANIRKGNAPSMSTVSTIVRVLRRHGYSVQASDIVDVGEETNAE